MKKTSMKKDLNYLAGKSRKSFMGDEATEDAAEKSIKELGFQKKLKVLNAEDDRDMMFLKLKVLDKSLSDDEVQELSDKMMEQDDMGWANYHGFDKKGNTIIMNFWDDLWEDPEVDDNEPDDDYDEDDEDY